MAGGRSDRGNYPSRVCAPAQTWGWGGNSNEKAWTRPLALGRRREGEHHQPCPRLPGAQCATLLRAAGQSWRSCPCARASHSRVVVEDRGQSALPLRRAPSSRKAAAALLAHMRSIRASRRDEGAGRGGMIVRTRQNPPSLAGFATNLLCCLPPPLPLGLSFPVANIPAQRTSRRLVISSSNGLYC